MCCSGAASATTRRRKELGDESMSLDDGTSGFSSEQMLVRDSNGEAGVVAILDAVDLPIVLLGGDCRIIRFNKAAATVLRLKASDIGQSPSHILGGIPGLDQSCAQVIADGTQLRREIRDTGSWLLLRIAPYNSRDDPNGAVLTFTNVTALRESLDQAIYEREYTKAILNTVIEPLVVLDTDLRIQTANQSFYTMWRCSRGDIRDIPLYNLGDADWKASSVWESLRASLTENTEFHSVELEREFPGIGCRSIVIDARRLLRAGDAALLLVFRDITDYKRAQETIRQRTIQFETLLNQAPLGVYLVDADFQIREINPVALAVFGEIPGGAVGRDFDEIIHILWEREHADELVRLFRHTLETGESYLNSDWGENRKDRGVAEYYEWRIDRILLPEGRFGVVCYFSEISHRRRAELNANLLAAIVESSEDAIVSKDLNGIIKSWNQGAQRLFGYTAAETVGQSITLIIPPDRLDEEPKILERLKRGERVEHFETIRMRKDASRLNVSLTISPVKDAGGRIVGASKVARDITPRVRQQEALQAVNVALARANADLQHFAHSASHDLQEPLRTVGIYTELLQKKFSATLGPAGEEFTGRIVEGVRRLDSLLRDLRIYTQVSMTDQAATDEINAGEVLKKALLNLEVAIEESAASISIAPLPRVRMHEFQLEQVFQNLIGNAIRYHGELPPRIQIAAERRGEAWQFSVRDHGIGIEPQYQERVFEMFKRLDTGAAHPGTGMGLAICKRIVELAGGRLWVESELGRGSTFYFTVPGGTFGPGDEESIVG
jgi:PAS domain S-box-containing protein